MEEKGDTLFNGRVWEDFFFLDEDFFGNEICMAKFAGAAFLAFVYFVRKEGEWVPNNRRSGHFLRMTFLMGTFGRF